MADDKTERTGTAQQLIDTLGEKPAAAFIKCVCFDDTAVSTALARQTRMLMVTMAGFTLTIWVLLTIGALT